MERDTRLIPPSASHNRPIDLADLFKYPDKDHVIYYYNIKKTSNDNGTTISYSIELFCSSLMITQQLMIKAQIYLHLSWSIAIRKYTTSLLSISGASSKTMNNLLSNLLRYTSDEAFLKLAMILSIMRLRVIISSARPLSLTAPVVTYQSSRAVQTIPS